MSSRPRQNVPSSSRRQEYIVKIRYQNPLPPPPFPPKFLKIQMNLDDFTSPTFASNLIHTDQLNLDFDHELCMPLELSDHLNIFLGEKEQEHTELLDNEADQKLLVLHETQNGADQVSFLRRTEYISSETAIRNPSLFTENIRSQVSPRKSYQAEEQRGKSLNDAEAQADEIEKLFDKVSKIDPKDLKHARKRDVYAQEVWDLLPETEHIIPQCFLLKFNSMPSSLTNLENTILVPEGLDNSEEQLRFFVPDSSNDTILKQNRILEGKVQYGNVDSIERIAIVFDESEKVARFTQIHGFASMKPKRLTTTEKHVLRLNRRDLNETERENIKKIKITIDPEG